MNTRLNALLIDESKEANSYNRSLLVQTNCFSVIKECDTGIKAVQYLTNYLDDELFPDIIFMELKMPDIDGLQVLNKYEGLVFDRIIGLNPVIVVLSSYMNEKKYESLNSLTEIEKLMKPLKNEDVNYLMNKYFKPSYQC